jgi:hypothetical protein
MIHITLGEMKPVEPKEDFLGRSYIGWSVDMSEEQLYEAGRGCWVFGARADREHYVLLSAQGAVRQAIEIDRLVPAGPTRRAIEGTVLGSGHPVYDAYVGKPSPVEGARNPITYFNSPYGARTCACECGDPVALGYFLPGHDQKALHDRVAQIGTVYEFIRWFDGNKIGTVYVTASGDKWHSREDCPGIKAGQKTAAVQNTPTHGVEGTSRAKAVERGMQPCRNCALGH